MFFSSLQVLINAAWLPPFLEEIHRDEGYVTSLALFFIDFDCIIPRDVYSVFVIHAIWPLILLILAAVMAMLFGFAQVRMGSLIPGRAG